jgi:hypothetical protein
MITSMGMLLSNLKALLATFFAFIKPIVIESWQCIDDGTILRPFNIEVDLTRHFEDVQKAFIRQCMIQ